MQARYLIRFDDICPTMNWSVWGEVEYILTKHGIAPLLAVVPHNQDPELDVQPANPEFWSRVRGWQRQGWSIGLHGFEHRYVTKASGILGRNAYSEFAGLPEAEQRRKLEQGLAKFTAEGVHADAWVAPAHSFDRATVRILRELGVDTISDGYSLSPYLSGNGVLWVPQQLGAFRRMPFGIWTVCLHFNNWDSRQVRQFGEDVRAFRDAAVDLDWLKRRYGVRRRGVGDRAFAACFRMARLAKGALGQNAG